MPHQNGSAAGQDFGWAVTKDKHLRMAHDVHVNYAAGLRLFTTNDGHAEEEAVPAVKPADPSRHHHRDPS